MNRTYRTGSRCRRRRVGQIGISIVRVAAAALPSRVVPTIFVLSFRPSPIFLAALTPVFPIACMLARCPFATFALTRLVAASIVVTLPIIPIVIVVPDLAHLPTRMVAIMIMVLRHRRRGHAQAAD